jgi:hypothetical protein
MRDGWSDDGHSIPQPKQTSDLKMMEPLPVGCRPTTNLKHVQLQTTSQQKS